MEHPPGASWIRSLVPALSGVVGKVALAAAFATAWATALGVRDVSFVRENVRLELILASVLTLVVTVVLRIPAAPPGTLAPLIALVPAMAAAGVHPLSFGLLVGAMGLLTAALGWQDRLMRLNGPGTRGGILVLFAIMGFHSALKVLWQWAAVQGGVLTAILLGIVGTALSFGLKRLNVRWLTIPAIAVVAVFLPLLLGQVPEWSTGIGLPIMDPSRWWQDIWGIGWGLEPVRFARALPFVLLVLVMWPIDAMAVETVLQRQAGGRDCAPAVDYRKTACLAALRNMLGATLGGAQTAAIWRSFMIPLGVMRGPLRRSALYLGLLGIAAGLLGYPIDLAVYPPLLSMVLVFGIYLPLLETGLAALRAGSARKTAGICIVAGLAVHPVAGWFLSLLYEKWDSRTKKSTIPEVSVREGG